LASYYRAQRARVARPAPRTVSDSPARGYIGRVAPLLVGLAAAVSISCVGTPNPVQSRPQIMKTRPLSASDDRSLPSSEPARAPFPEVQRVVLGNGLSVSVVELHTTPIVALRIVLDAGVGRDASKVGCARLAARILRAGWTGERVPEERERAKPPETSGSMLGVEIGPDSTQVSISVPSARLDQALQSLSDAVPRPRFDAREFEHMKQLESERATSRLLSDASWEARMVLFRRLYGDQPYAHFDAVPSELQALSLDECKAWYRGQVTPQSAHLVIVGDVAFQRAVALARRAFDDWLVRPAFMPPRSEPRIPSERRIWLVDRADLDHSELLVAGLGPRRRSTSWAAIAVDSQLLNDRISTPTRLDARTQPSLVLPAASILLERRNGRVPIVLGATARTEGTATSLRELLDHVSRLWASPAKAAEVRTATHAISSSLISRAGNVDSLARLVASAQVFELPPDYYVKFLNELRRLDPGRIFASTLQTVDFWSPLIVVVGDARRVAESLRSFGTVVILDPHEEFAVSRELPRL
jgi:zinc protease